MKKELKLSIGDLLWHPCSVDIIPHKIISKTEYVDRVIYTSKALGNVGASGRVEVELSIDIYDTIRFIGLAANYEYGSGLQDFVEGIYYTVHNKARKEYYEIQKTLIWSNMDTKKRIYEEAKQSYDRCCAILDEVNESLELTSNKLNKD